MDEVTQQNSALVEQNAAAAKALEQQSQAMDQQVSIFRLGDAAPAAAALQPVAAFRRTAADSAKSQPATAQKQLPAKAAAHSATAPKRAPRRGMNGGGQATLATAVRADADWKEF